MKRTLNEPTQISSVLVAGAVVGLVAGLLLAPKSGKDTRGGIRRRLQETQDRAKLRAVATQNDIHDATENVVDHARTETKSVVVDAKDIVAEARILVDDIALDKQPRPRNRRSTTL